MNVPGIIEELRSEFDYMSDIAGSTPKQYALRVRTHPGVLQIFASNFTVEDPERI